MHRISWRVFKVAYLSTEEDKIKNKQKFKKLLETSQKILHSKGNILDTEEYLLFYTEEFKDVKVFLQDNHLFIYKGELEIINLSLHSCVLRIAIKESKLMLKFDCKWKMKIQIDFYIANDVSDFIENLNKILNRYDTMINTFVFEMKELTGDMGEYSHNDPIYTLEQAASEFSKLVHKN